MGEYPAGSWAVVLGASSGFGAASALALGERGMDVFGIHLDRKATLANAERVRAKLMDLGRKAFFFNVNAADPEKRKDTVARIKEILAEQEGAHVRVLFHSIAFGTLKPFVAMGQGASVTRAQMDMTIDVMANTLVYWVQELLGAGCLRQGSRILAMTSAGARRVWPQYGPVSAAKAALEAHVRQLAVELAPLGMTVNALEAGVTDTPALRKIPLAQVLLDEARARNPSGRVTTPADVASVVCMLAGDDSRWITGNVVAVDGGEHLL